MEKERFFCAHSHLQPVMEMNCQQSDQLLPPCFLNLNWDQSMEQGSHFGSALSSIVSSPSNQAPSVTDTTSSAIMGELIGRLGSICNSGEISPQPHQFLGGGNNSSNTSCYTTPLNSPSKLNLSTQGNLPISGNMPPPPATQLPPFSADPGFQERAAMFSCFGGRNYTQALGAGGTQMSGPDVPMQDRLPLGMEVRPKVGTVPGRSVTLEESSVSDHTMIGSGSNTRKRKASQKGRAKDAPLTPISKDLPKVAEEDSLNAKKTKSSETTGTGNDDVKLKAEPSNSTNSGGGEEKPEKERNPKATEPPKQDYIHVRARRGQATDSHSLAERVRREKISERMKFLQDLVPGCNKVTGKAVMLDEIINYVQSLQRQVEFLSMKLATVNPRMDLNMENLLHKDMHQSRASLLSSGFPTEISAPAFTFAPQPPHSTPHQNIMTGCLENHCPVNSLESTVRKTVYMQLPSLEGFGDFSTQAGVFWDDDLQNVVQMGFGQNQESVSSTAFHGASPTASAQMKVEL